MRQFFNKKVEVRGKEIVVTGKSCNREYMYCSQCLG